MFRQQANPICLSNQIWKMPCPHCFLQVIRSSDFWVQTSPAYCIHIGCCGNDIGLSNSVCNNNFHVQTIMLQSRCAAWFGWPFCLSGFDNVIVCHAASGAKDSLKNLILATRESGLKSDLTRIQTTFKCGLSLTRKIRFHVISAVQTSLSIWIWQQTDLGW